MAETMRQAPDFVNYRPDRKTFAGIIYESDFDTEPRKEPKDNESSYFAQRIATAQRFDHHCSTGCKQREMRANNEK